MTEIVFLNQSEKAVTTSLLMADFFKKEHKSVLKAIRNLECSDQFLRRNLAPTNYKDSHNRNQPSYEITKDGFSILAMGFTGKEAMEWKERYIALFNKMERTLRAIHLERKAGDWNVTRIDGKMQRRKLTDILAPFKLYALGQDSKGTAANTFSNFTQIVNKAAGINAKERDLLTDDMLRRVAHLEGIVEMKVKGLMDQGMYCKKIYQECKKMLGTFVELVPYTGKMYLPTKQVTILELDLSGHDRM